MPYRTHKLQTCIPILMTACLVSTAHAVQPIPEEDGISGFINLGFGGYKVENNLFSESPLGDIGDDRIKDRTDSPDHESSAMGILNFEVAYTWADSRTQVYIGNQLEDYVRFDFATSVGVRQEIEGVGTLGVSFINSSFKTKVFEDPYAENVKRSDTDQESKGFRLELDRILGSHFELRYSKREVDIDDEFSGRSVGSLTAVQRGQLDREGDIKRADIAYTFDLGDNGLLVPRLSAIDYDLDGDAMQNDGWLLELGHTIKHGRFRYVTNLAYANFEFDDINPIYAEEDETDRMGASFNIFWDDAFGLVGWAGNVGVAFYEDDHDIDFYDTEISLVNFSLLHRF